MKTAIVPAQITTVEDKVAGNLGLTQLLLLAAPVFIGSAIYIIFPPSLGAAVYKLVLVTIISVVFALLAIRVKGRILLLWAITIARYNLRPRHYVFDKNDMHLRSKSVKGAESEASDQAPTRAASSKAAPSLSTQETVMLEGIIANPDAKLHFRTDRKGGLSVRITEVK